MAILKRTVYFDPKLKRFWDWCKETTSLGTMVAPFAVAASAQTGSQVFNVDVDEMNRIDEIINADWRDSQSILCGETTTWAIGGDNIERLQTRY